ncbi:MAG: tRNA isopentenyltransferase MiaA [Bacteroidetes bacterium OLB12]|nr:MAG: tRNA isopentenyltransferase MiaA [Bacteroidetes bacterium OLB12]
MNKPRVLVITGPTASGKTKLAIELALALNTEIISADSRQFYRELPIGSAMPTASERNAVKHHFIACRSVLDEYSAGSYALDARQKIQELLLKHSHVIVCGGSGLYINALLHGMDVFPAVSETIKQKVELIFKEQGIAGLQELLKEADPAYFAEVDIQNPARLRRALEVCYAGDKPYSAYRTHSKNAHFDYLAFGVGYEKEQLHQRIHHRVDEMIELGLENEARSVYPNRDLKALQTVGYTEFFDYFDGKLSKTECVEQIKTHTRQYAKRQMTWFSKQLEVEWLNPESSVQAILKNL